MAEFAIMRTEKLKSRRAILGAVLHNTREAMPPNADPKRSNYNFTPDSSQEIMERYSALLPQKVRKDAVHAVEVIATASPDWFNGPKKGDIGAFGEATMKWCNRFFGKDNVISVTIHIDEMTPHIHVIAMPLVNGKLNAKALLGGSKYRMREIQDDFYAAVGKPLGMERGVILDKPKRHTMPREIGRIVKELEAERAALAADRKALETERAAILTDKKTLATEWAELNQAKKAMFTETMKGTLGAKFQEYGLDSAEGIADYWRAFGEAFSLAQERRQARAKNNRTLKHTAEPKRTR